MNVRRFGVWTATVVAAIGMIALARCGLPEDQGGREPTTVQDGGSYESEGTDTKKVEYQCKLQPLEALPQSILPRCSADTASCIRQCYGASDSCSTACLANDKVAAEPSTGLDCAGCTIHEFMLCTEKSQCKSTLDKYRCCLQANCKTNPSTCEKTCEPQLQALYACAGTLANKCITTFYSNSICYPQRYDRSKCSEVKIPTSRPTQSEPRCSAETSKCVKACGENDVDCQFKCLYEDKTLASKGIDCTYCVYNEYLSCMKTAGCQKEIQLQLCCENQNCAQAADFTQCSSTRCYEENLASNQCAESKGMACVNAFVSGAGTCYPTSKP